MNDELTSSPRREGNSESDEISRRQWLLQIGEMVALAGVSGLVPESAAALLGARQGADPTATALPPGLYDPSQDHLVHALSSGGRKWSPPPGSETDYVQPNLLPYQPRFFSADEFRGVVRFFEILLGEVAPIALAQATQWFDLWLHSAAGVRAAALHLDPLHRILAAAVNGEESVRKLETADPGSVARAGLGALHDLSVQAHGREFLQLTASQQIDLLMSIGAAQPGVAQANHPLQKFFEIARAEAARGYYTSASGLKELDYKGNAYYPDSPGCETKP